MGCVLHDRVGGREREMKGRARGGEQKAPLFLSARCLNTCTRDPAQSCRFDALWIKHICLEHEPSPPVLLPCRFVALSLCPVPRMTCPFGSSQAANAVRSSGAVAPFASFFLFSFLLERKERKMASIHRRASPALSLAVSLPPRAQYH